MESNRMGPVLYAVVWGSLALSLLAFDTGCAYDPCRPGYGIDACAGGGSETGAGDDMGGGDEEVIGMPFAAGTTARCTQEPGGSTSHTYTSTAEAADFDTPNDVQMAVYAPVGGIAYVHVESATANFGYHVNIVYGDGYVVVAHFSVIFIADGEEVAAGQLIGFDGCTGACTGDHVHIGLMEGDPAEMAQYGTSVPVSFWAMDTSADGGAFSAIAGEDLVCGTSAGHVYESALPVPQWHPGGTLIMVPNSPSVYLVEDGKARWIDNERTFWSFNWDFDDLVYVSEEELACLGEGDMIYDEGSVGAAYDEDGDAWLIVEDYDGTAWKQALPSDGAEEVLASWGISDDDLGMDGFLSDETFALYDTRSGTVPFRDGSILKEESRSDLYVVSDGVALPVKDWDTYLLMGFGNREILTVDDGMVEDVMGDDNVGSCTAGIRCLDAEAVTTCGGGLELGSGESGGEEVGEEEEEDAEEEEEVDEEEEEEAEEDTGDEEVVVDDDEEEIPVETDTAEETEVEVEVEADTAEEAVDTAEEAEEEDEEEELDPEDTDEWSDYIWIDGDDLCFSADGFSFPYDAADAYLVGYGGTTLNLDFTFQEEFLLSESGGAYCLDTSALDFDDYEATLVSSLTSSGGSATSYADTGDWWDNYDLCTSGTSSSDQYCAYQGGWDYLVAFSVTSSGLIASGDGV